MWDVFCSALIRCELYSLNRLLRIFIIVVSACILLYSSYQIYIIVSDRAASNSINADLVQNAVTVKQETESPKDNDPQDPQTSPDPEQTADTVPIEVNFKNFWRPTMMLLGGFTAKTRQSTCQSYRQRITTIIYIG